MTKNIPPAMLLLTFLAAIWAQDILDAVAWARDSYPVDPQRVYLTGASGGGHMTLLMVRRVLEST
jgi:acetyl esterase/lipase